MTYIVFNNEIFGLTKGQTSPTSPKGHKSKTQPHGSAKDPVRPLSLSLASGASYIARTAAVNPNQAKEIIAEAIEHDGFAHIDFLTQCPTWNKDAKQYVPYTDVQQSDDYAFDTSSRQEAAEMMYETETKLHEGEVLTGRYYVDERPSYGEEKRATGEMPDDPLAGMYYDDDTEWERTADTLLDRHR
jgi:pyruvate ferredoxin oxidoreductase beta subunit